MKSVFSKGSILLLLAAAILLGGCSLLGLDEEEDSGPSTVDPADAEALTDALVVPSGASIVDGSLSGYVSGSAVSGSNDTTLTVDSSSITMANGGSYALNLTSSGSNAVAGVALQVSGSGRYYQIPQSAGANATFSINVGLPTNVGSGSFTLILVLYDSSGSGSNGVSLPVTVEQVGTGALQVQLTWNTDNTDLDLHIVEPGGDRIYYGDPEGDQSGGELDVDDTNGRGPENIFFDSLCRLPLCWWQYRRCGFRIECF